MRLGRKVFVGLLLAMVGVFGIFGASADVQALDTGEIMKKWVFVGFKDCVKNGRLNKNLSNNQTGSVAGSVMKHDASTSVKLPSYQFGHSISSGSISCYDNFMGSGGISGVINYGGIDRNVAWGDTAGTNAILQDKLKYKFEASANGSKYFNIFASGSYRSCTSFNVCSGRQDAPIRSAKVEALGGNKYRIENDGLYTISLNISNTAKTLTIGLGSNCNVINGSNPFPIEAKFGNNIDDFVKNVNGKLDGISFSYMCSDAAVTTEYSITFGTAAANVGSEGTYRYQGETGKVIKTLSGMDLKDLKLDENQRYVLYQHYINQAGRVDCEAEHDNAANWTKVENWRVNGEFKTCYANFNGAKPSTIKVSTITNSNSPSIDPDFDLQQAIDWMKQVDTDKLTDIDTVTNGGVTSDNGVDPCWNAGIESQSWFLCPTLNNLTYTAGPLEGMIEDWLAVDPNLYDFDSPTYTVWEVMRNIANTVMIVFLLVVIFSQLTGYGIDNYGIKKMLPRLLVMAILINLSFVICEVAVDLSNILGSALRDMFGSIGEGLLNSRNMESYLEEFIGTVVTWLLVAATAGGAVSGTVLTIVGVSGDGVMVAVVLILALVVVLAALLLFFVMLGARMIIVIGCVAVAPIAFALFILPNTQNWFKRWWSLFKAGLIIFPICGAVAGVSVLIKGIVLSTDEIQMWMLVVALIAPFLPFFLLPTLLKETIAGLGKIGGALTSMGERFTGGVRGVSDAVRGSNRYQEAAQYGKDLTAARRAQRTLNKYSGVDRSTLSARQQQRLLAAEQTANAQTAREAQAAVGTFPLDAGLALSRAQSSVEAQELKAYQDQFAGFDRNALGAEALSAATWFNQPGGTQRMSALISAMEANGMEKNIAAMLNTVDVGNNSTVMQTLANSSNKVFKAYGKRGSGQSYKNFMEGGGMAQYVAEKGTDFLSGLDDKALGEINKYSNNNNQIMSTDLLTEAAAKMNSQDAVNEIDSMLDKRSGITMSAEQLQQFNASTIAKLTARGKVDSDVQAALIKASNDLAANPDLLSRLSAPNRQAINSFRTTVGLNAM